MLNNVSACHDSPVHLYTLSRMNTWASLNKQKDTQATHAMIFLPVLYEWLGKAVYYYCSVKRANTRSSCFLMSNLNYKDAVYLCRVHPPF